MNVGWIGLGKLGLPCAMVLAQHHVVHGYDVSDLPRQILNDEAPAPQEEGFDGLRATGLTVVVEDSVYDVVANTDVVFVAVQTPHAPAYGGEQPMPHTQRRDFEYAYLVQAVRDVAAAAARQRRPVTVVVVSTVLPGTTNRLLRPLTNAYTTLVYSPAFIAMGTTVADFQAPEFVIAGADQSGHTIPLRQVLARVHNRPVVVTSFESAEAVKVFYNTFISMKIVFANMLMEVCHKTGADSDVVVDALAMATDRVISPRYLRGGMGDGGACHPRDLIALSWLADRLDLSYDLLGEMAHAREAQTMWLAGLADGYADQTGLPVVILGEAYKPGSDLTAGSPALLLRGYLEDGSRTVRVIDPHTGAGGEIGGPAVYVIGARHPEWPAVAFPPRSVVLDPFGYIPDTPGVTVIRVGRK